MAELAIATALSFALAAAIVLARVPAHEPADTGSKAGQVVAEVPAQTTQTSEPFEDIRIVDPPPEKRSSCADSVWPYIDQRCSAAAKSENDAKRNGKIGPRPIDSEPRPNPLANATDRNIPIGSMTAIIPTRPAVSTTDGVAIPESDERIVETGPAEETEPGMRAPRDRTRNAVKIREAAREVAGRPKADPPRRHASVEKKKKRNRQVADAGRRTDSRRIANGAPEMPPFFFPFGLFSQAR